MCGRGREDSLDSKGKRAVILCHGDFNDRGFELRPDDILICADGGAEHASLAGWRPHLIVGDLDSLSPEIRQKWKHTGTQFAEYPVEKDKTDSELALEYALKLDVDEILILGALGGRIDHMLTNVFMLSRIPGDREAKIISGLQRLWLTSSFTRIEGQRGDTVSLIPLSRRVVGVTTTGLYYPLDDGVMEFGSSLGNSNVMVEDVATVTVSSGRLLVVHIAQDKSRGQ